MTAGQTQWHKPGDPSLATSTTATAPADSAAFISADAFSGPRAGYVYKQGTQGTGYYKDQGPMVLSGTCVLKGPCYQDQHFFVFRQGQCVQK